MIKDAEAYAEEDRRRREQVETRNQADQLVHQTEKVLSEQGDKLAEDEKARIESALAELKAVIDDASADVVHLRAKIDSLVTVSQSAFSRMYQESSQQQAARVVPPEENPTTTWSKPKSLTRVRALDAPVGRSAVTIMR